MLGTWERIVDGNGNLLKIEEDQRVRTISVGTESMIFLVGKTEEKLNLLPVGKYRKTESSSGRSHF
jgi:hypothetical protein